MADENQTEFNVIEEQVTSKKSTWSKFFRLPFFLLLVIPFFLLLTWFYLQNPSTNFPVTEKFVIKVGSGLKQIAEQSKRAGLVRSEYLLLAELVLGNKGQTVKAGSYYFTKPLTTPELADVFFLGNPNGELIRITHIEGEPVKSLALRASKILPNFSSEEFISINSMNEGVLFPDTYFISKDFTTDDLTDLLLNTFTEKTKSLKAQSEDHFLDWNQIVILASILEREANSKESKKMVSGILQNRLKIGMALQADASMEYVLDKPLGSLNPEDLERDTPYNTYLYNGLPPTPIGNPGLNAIDAVIHPIESDYYFYITGRDGNFYYAKNFDQHRENIARHLR